MGTNIQEKHHHTTLKTSVITLSMVESILELWKELKEVLNHTGHYEKCLTPEGKDFWKELTQFLKTFREMAELVSTNEPHLGLIPMLKDQIREAAFVSQKDKPAVKTLKENVFKKLDTCLPVAPEQKIQRI